MDRDQYAHSFYTVLVYEIAKNLYEEDPEDQSWMERSKAGGYTPSCVETEVTFVGQFVGAVLRKNHVRATYPSGHLRKAFNGE